MSIRCTFYDIKADICNICCEPMRDKEIYCSINDGLYIIIDDQLFAIRNLIRGVVVDGA